MRPPRPTPGGQGRQDEEPRVTTLELFFDLVFVFTLTQLTGVLVDRLGPLGVLQVLLLFGVLWWMYGGYAWLTNAVMPTTPYARMLLILGMAGFLIVALAIPTAFDGGGVALGVGYLIVVCVHAALFRRSAAGIGRVGPFNIASALIVLGAGFVDGPPAYVLWAVALLLQAATPMLAAPERWHTVNPAHFVERHGLLMIVALGESVVAIGIGAAGLDLTTELLVTATLGLLLSAALWWMYFGGDDEAAERVLRDSAPVDRVGLALRAYFYAHIPMLLGIIVLAVGVKNVLAHADEHLHLGPALALAGGVGLYVLGDAWFRRVLGIGPILLRSAAGLALLLTVPVGVALNGITQLGAVLAIVALTLAVETRRARLAAPA
ncbi:MAG: low temperature requirement protein A [Streptosporangiales bacterium]|nr:low temperature requirement protein A [Streptosporangiales bacterium]